MYNKTRPQALNLNLNKKSSPPKVNTNFVTENLELNKKAWTQFNQEEVRRKLNFFFKL